MKLFNKTYRTTYNKSENRGSTISNIGGLFTIIGIVLMTIKSPFTLTFSSLLIGVFLAAYGAISISKSKN